MLTAPGGGSMCAIMLSLVAPLLHAYRNAAYRMLELTTPKRKADLVAFVRTASRGIADRAGCVRPTHRLPYALALSPDTP